MDKHQYVNNINLCLNISLKKRKKIYIYILIEKVKVTNLIREKCVFIDKSYVTQKSKKVNFGLAGSELS